MQQMGIAPGQPVIPGQVPAVATNPYLTGIPANTYSPYFAPGHLVPALLGPDPSAVASQLGPVVPQAVQVAQQKIPRSDRLEVCREFMRGACKRAESECRFAHPQESVARHDDGSITVCMDAVKGRCARDPCRYFHPPLHLQAQLKAAQSRATAVAAAAATASVNAATLTHHPTAIPTPVAAAHPAHTAAPPTAVAISQHQLEMGKKRAAENDMFQLAFSGMVPYKRPAAEKSGIPVYQPGATTYQQLMQLQQPFVPVSCEYQSQNTTSTTINCTTTTAAAASATTATTTICANTTPQVLLPPPPPQPPMSMSISNTSMANQNYHINSANLNNQSNINNNSNNNLTTTTTTATAATISNYLMTNSSSNIQGSNSNSLTYYNNNNNNNNLSYVNKNNYLSNKLATTATTSNNIATSAAAITSLTTTATSTADMSASNLDTINSSNNSNNIGSSNSKNLNSITLNGNSDSNNNTNSSSNDNCSTNNNNSISNSNNNSTASTNTYEYNDENDAIANASHSPLIHTPTDHAQSDNEHESIAHSPNTPNGTNFSSSLTANATTNSSLLASNACESPTNTIVTTYNAKVNSEPTIIPSTVAMNGDALGNAPSYSTSSVITPGVGILPTPTTSVVTNAYQAQQNMQRLYNTYAAAPTSYGSYMAAHSYGATPASSTAHTSQAITNAQYQYAVSAAASGGVTIPTFTYPNPYTAVAAPAAATSGYYTDAATLAKEVAQKNYANAVKLAAATNHNLTGKPLTAAAYTGMSLNKCMTAVPATAATQQQFTHHALLQAHQAHQAHQAQQQACLLAAQREAAAVAAATQMRALSSLPGSSVPTPVGTPVHTATPTAGLLPRPATAGYIQASNAAAAAAAAAGMMRPQAVAMQATASPQFAAMPQQQGFFYPGMMPATAAAYPFAAMGSMAGVMPAGMQAAMAAPGTASATSAMVLNPYKKMKTS
ncbi:mucin-5AC-like isoform X9 [Teleopsis dalmanni]|uniref:mucin-5AC-like isoform X9 n=1 Tax=Teleopsis dalmanni TaxID=139649 RepID=UPI0018CCC050|nr:mucin-5AC-like isoform X9 [Teleopsis dalmanni]